MSIQPESIEPPQTLRIIQFEKLEDPRGTLTVLEDPKQIPFEAKRCYWLYDIIGDTRSGGAGFQHATELVIALSGSFTVSVHDGVHEKSFVMRRPHQGLIIPKMHWRVFEEFSTNSVALIISSTNKKHAGKINTLQQFLKLKHA